MTRRLRWLVACLIPPGQHDWLAVLNPNGQDKWSAAVIDAPRLPRLQPAGVLVLLFSLRGFQSVQLSLLETECAKAAEMVDWLFDAPRPR